MELSNLLLGLSLMLLGDVLVHVDGEVVHEVLWLFIGAVIVEHVGVLVQGLGRSLFKDALLLKSLLLFKLLIQVEWPPVLLLLDHSLPPPL